MTGNGPGWAVELIGERFDLDDFREWLAPPFDPWVEDYSEDNASRLLLRSASWNSLTDVTDVYRDANRIIERLNGEALLIHNDAKPVKLGQPMRFGPDGRRERIMIAETGHFELTMARVRMKATGVTDGPPRPPQESRMQKWFREAEANDTRADLFVHIRRADNWYDYTSAWNWRANWPGIRRC